jgi:hypothetical protein
VLAVARIGRTRRAQHPALAVAREALGAVAAHDAQRVLGEGAEHLVLGLGALSASK